MKQLILLLISVIILSCGQPGAKSTKQDSTEAAVSKADDEFIKAKDSLQAIINTNVHSLPVIDTICMGFTFNMTERQALEHFNQLIKEKKLVKNTSDGRYEYPLTFELTKANATIAPQFHNDKLYQLGLVIESADELATEQTIYLQAATTYMKKYSNYRLFQEPDWADESNKQFHWIKNNLHISLHKSTGGAVVKYTNLLVDKDVEKEKSVAADSSKAQTKKDI